MNDRLAIDPLENGKVIEGKKYHPNAVKDVKRKLSFMNKKISDLHHQRKFAYKNSVKVKKMVHNQVNQIVKCLRARERSLWSDVDEAFMSQDESISDELSRLQSIHARCQVLFNHLDDFKGNENILSKIYSILAEVNFGEKSDTKALEFISDFEEMKIRASSYGHLEGDFFKKDDFILIADKKGNSLSNVVHSQFLEKEDCCDQTMPVSNIDFTTSGNSFNKFPACKEADFEDSFQIIDLFDNLCCHEDNTNEDYIMYEEDSLNCTQQMEKELNRSSACEAGNKLVKVYGSSEDSYEVSKSSRGFNPEDEWKQILEMNKKIADFKEIFKPHEEMKIKHKIHDSVDKHRNTNKPNKFLLLKEADNWLCSLSSKKDITVKEKYSGSINLETNLASPSELIRKAFKLYLTKDSASNWLSHN